MKKAANILKFTIVILIALIFITSGFIPFVFPAKIETGFYEVGAPPDENAVLIGTRSAAAARGGDLEINGTQVVTISSTQSNSSIWVHDDATLIVDGATLTVQPLGLFKVSENAKLEIKSGSTVTCVWGTFTADCVSFKISDSTLKVSNGSDPDERYGYESNIYIKTTDDISIINSSIESNGGIGLGASTEIPAGGAGGESEIYIESSESVTITGKKANGIKSTGGNGGTGYTSPGGNGGAGRIMIKSGDGQINIKDASLLAKGGKGGDKDSSFGKKAGDGGDAYLDLYANEGKKKIIIDESDLTSQEGNSGAGDDTASDGISTVWMKSSDLRVDYAKKSESFPSNPDTTIKAKDGILVESAIAPNNAEFCVVNYEGENNQRVPPRMISDKKPEVYLYWWLTVIVTDESNKIIEDAPVDISSSSGIPILKRTDTTDATGKAYFLLACRILIKPQTPVEYDVTVSKFGAQTTVSGVELEDDNRELPINLKLVTVNFTSLMGFEPEPNMKVGGIVTIKGEAVPASGELEIESVTLKAGGSSVSVLDITPDPPSKPFLNWSANWDTRGIADGTIVTLIAEATDEVGYTARAELDVIVDQHVVNQAPVISFNYPDEFPYYNTSMIKNTVEFQGIAVDYDHDTDASLLPEGRNITGIVIEIRDSTGNLVPSSASNIMKLQKNSTISYQWDWVFEWNNVREMAQDAHKYPNGKYNVSLYAVDDGGLLSDTTVLTIYLTHHIYPIAVISKLEFNKDHTIIHPEITRAGTVATYRFDAPKGDNKVAILFDGSGSYDLDGVNEKPDLYYWEFDQISHSSWDTNSTETYEYILVPKDHEEKKVLPYNIKLIVKDSHNLQNQIIKVKKSDGSEHEVTAVELIITYHPPAEKNKGIFAKIVDLDLDLSTELFNVVFIIFIVVLNAVGGLAIVRNKKKIEKKRKTREAAISAREAKEQDLISQQTAEYLDYTPTPETETTAVQVQPDQPVGQVGGVAEIAATPPPAPSSVETPAQTVSAAPAAAAAAPVQQQTQQPAQPATAAAAAATPTTTTTTTAAPPAAAPAATTTTPETPAQMVPCPTCSSQIIVHTTPCPSCGTSLNWN